MTDAEQHALSEFETRFDHACDVFSRPDISPSIRHRMMLHVVICKLALIKTMTGLDTEDVVLQFRRVSDDWETWRANRQRFSSDKIVTKNDPAH